MARNSLKNVCRLIEQAKDKLSPEQSFLADLKRSIELEDEKHRKKPSQSYKPSSMNCIRNMYYQLSGAEPELGNSSYCLVGICNSGSDIHIRVQTAVAPYLTQCCSLIHDTTFITCSTVIHTHICIQMFYVNFPYWVSVTPSRCSIALYCYAYSLQHILMSNLPFIVVLFYILYRNSHQFILQMDFQCLLSISKNKTKPLEAILLLHIN